MHRRIYVISLECPSGDLQSRRLVVHQKRRRTDTVRRKFCHIHLHGYLLRLRTEDGNIRHLRNLKQPAPEILGILEQLRISLVGRLQGDKHGRYGTEIIQNGDCQHSGRKRHLCRLQPQLDLRPCLILFLRRDSQIHENITYPVSGI